MLTFVTLFTLLTLTKALPEQCLAEDAPKPFDIKAAHKLFMLYSWTILSDIIVLLAFYEYRRYTKLIHSILGSGLILTTIITSIPSLIKNGFHTKHLAHYVIGVMVYGIMGLQLLLGVAKFGLIYFNKGSSLSIYVIKIIHKYLGYGLVVLAKVQIFIFVDPERIEYSALLGWEIAVGVIFFYRMFTFPKLTATIQPASSAKKYIASLAEIQSNDKHFTIFGNYIYDLEPLRIGHPAGFKIIQAIKDESSDKYVYGMYSSESEPKVPKYSHTEASFKLLGRPLAKINIKSPFEGFNNEIVQVKVSKIEQIANKLFEVRLVKAEGFNFQYAGYSHQNQIGRYFSLTINSSITRLYTSVNFLTRKNKELLKAVYFNAQGVDLENQHNPEHTTSSSILSSLLSIEEAECLNELPLLIKQYDGSFTKKLNNLASSTLQLSSQKGFGLSFSTLQPGRILIVVGGTGLFPYCDLIDLLFKDHLSKNCDPTTALRIIKDNPILKRNPFKDYSFEVIGSFHSIEHIHKITLRQMQHLCKHSGAFRCLLNLSNKPSDEFKLTSFQFTDRRFQQILPEEINKNGLSKVWVCGPPRMNASLRQLLGKYLSKSQFQIM